MTMLGTLLGLLLAALDQTIVATAGPAIQRDLHVPASLYPWITTAYLVASTVMVPIYGKLSDLFGRKPILLVGIALFLAGSVMCGLSRTTALLIVSRAVQGLGSAALFTSAFAVVADIFEPAERGKYQGIFGACFALSSVVGPLLGGFLTDQLSWHWVFFVNVPLGAIAVFFIALKMPLLRRERDTRPQIDLLGALCLLASVVPFLIALSLGRHEGPSPEGRVWSAALIAISVVALVSFIIVERRATDPLLDLRLFTNRVFAIGNLATFLLGATFLSAIVFLPLFMVNVVGLSATSAGLTLTPLTFGIVAGNVISGQLVSRFGRYKPLMIVGNVILLCGFALLGFTLRPESSQTEVTLKMIVLGVGLGPSIPLYVLAIQNAVASKDLGVATASATFFRQIGATMGVSLLGVVFAMTLAAQLGRVTRPALLDLDLLRSADARTREVEAPRVTMHVDVPAYSRAIAARYGTDPEREQAALRALHSYDQGTKRAFTTAIERIYRWGLLIAALGLIATLGIPELALRSSRARKSSPALD